MSCDFFVTLGVIRNGGKLTTWKNQRVKFESDSICVAGPGQTTLKTYGCDSINYKLLKVPSPTGKKRLTIGLKGPEVTSITLEFDPPHDQYIDWVVASFNKMIEANKERMSSNKKNIHTGVSQQQLASSSRSSQNNQTIVLKNDPPKQISPKRFNSQPADSKPPLTINKQLAHSQTTNDKPMDKMISKSDPFDIRSKKEKRQRSGSNEDISLKKPKKSEPTRSNVSPSNTENVSPNVQNTYAHNSCEDFTPADLEHLDDGKFKSEITVSTDQGSKGNQSQCSYSSPVSNSSSTENRRLLNTGNSCYFNSTMQALSACPSFGSRCKQLSRLLKNKQNFESVRTDSLFTNKFVLLNYLLKMMSVLTSRAATVENADILKSPDRSFLSKARRRIGIINKDFDNDDQQDAHEYLTALFGYVDDVLEANFKFALKGSVLEQSMALLNPINAFKYDVESLYICQNCDKESIRINSHNDLILPVSDNGSIQHLFKAFSNWNVVEKVCPYCSHKLAYSTDRVSNFPQNLVINLKLYEMDKFDFTTRKKEFSLDPSFEIDASELKAFSSRDNIEMLKSSFVEPSTPTPSTSKADDENSNFEIETDENDEKTEIDLPVKLFGGSVDMEISSQTSEVIVEEVKQPKDFCFKLLSKYAVVEDILLQCKIKPDEKVLKCHLEDLSQIAEAKMTQTCQPAQTTSIKADGNCFYRAISWCLTGKEVHHGKLRRLTADYLEKHEDSFKKYCDVKDYTAYLKNVKKDSEWTKTCEIFAMANMLNVEIFTYLPDGLWASHTPQNMVPPRDGCIYLNNTSCHFEPTTSLKESKEIKENSCGNSSRKPRNYSQILESQLEVARGYEDDEKIEETSSKKELLLGDSPTEKKKSKEKQVEEQFLYTLVSVVCHLGESPNRGHYVAYTKDLYNDEWLYCSDNTILCVSKDEVQAAIHNSGYIFFYERVLEPIRFLIQ